VLASVWRAQRDSHRSKSQGGSEPAPATVAVRLGRF